MKKVEALFISDVHLGSKGSNPEKLLNVLKEYRPETLFIVGDFIDGWLLGRRSYWPQSHINVINKIFSYSKKGTKIVYLSGNHDEFLRKYEFPLFGNDNIIIPDEFVWNDYYIVHGDIYDGVVQLKWLAHAGAIGYELAISIDRILKFFGNKRSISKWAKDSVKGAVKFVTNFENQLVYEAKKRNCKGVICGHIHKPSNKIIDGIHYLNCGDWIENNSYIIFNKGKFESLIVSHD
jgi:UDP-2,3-diacylglucosamine pyrophosphatase LpxH